MATQWEAGALVGRPQLGVVLNSDGERLPKA